LQDFPGCVVIVSQDRYFMDKLVDHLLYLKATASSAIFPATTANGAKNKLKKKRLHAAKTRNQKITFLNQL
jgi:ATPase subunit of ABC transporter with duplicated ATPase domains